MWEPIDDPIEWFGVLAAIGALAYIIGAISYWHRSDAQHRKVYRILHGHDRPW